MIKNLSVITTRTTHDVFNYNKLDESRTKAKEKVEQFEKKKDIKNKNFEEDDAFLHHTTNHSHTQSPFFSHRVVEQKSTKFINLL